MLSLEQIKQILTDAAAKNGPTHGLLGAQAGQLLRDADPKFRVADYQARSLSDLIATHVSELVPVSSSGADRRYGLAGWATKRADDEPERYLWQVWASPNTPYALKVNRETGATVACSLASSTDERHVVLRAPDDTRSRQMAASFLATVDIGAELRAELEQHQRSESSFWWRLWQYRLRQQAPELVGAWHDHRRRHLAQLLVEELRLQEFAPDLVERVVAAVTSSKGARPIVRKATTPPVMPASLCELVMALVPRLSDDELRRMTLPLGVVLDVLGVDLKGPR